MKNKLAIEIKNKLEFNSLIYFMGSKGFKYKHLGIPTYGNGLYAITYEDDFELIPKSSEPNYGYDIIEFSIFEIISGIECINQKAIKLNDFVTAHILSKENRVGFTNPEGQISGQMYLSFDDINIIHKTMHEFLY